DARTLPRRRVCRGASSVSSSVSIIARGTSHVRDQKNGGGRGPVVSRVKDKTIIEAIIGGIFSIVGTVIVVIICQPSPHSTHSTPREPATTVNGSPPPSDIPSQPSQRPPLPPSATDTITALHLINIDFSVPRKDLEEWLGNPESTAYPAIASALLTLANGR